MTQNLHQMTNTELKQYISKHRNDEEEFRAALEVLMSRSDPSTKQPLPFDLADPDSEIKALLMEKLKKAE